MLTVTALTDFLFFSGFATLMYFVTFIRRYRSIQCLCNAFRMNATQTQYLHHVIITFATKLFGRKLLPLSVSSTAIQRGRIPPHFFLFMLL
jgi:hypothetical protein